MAAAILAALALVWAQPDLSRAGLGLPDSDGDTLNDGIEVLELGKRIEPGILTKSSLMLGLGENDEEISLQVNAVVSTVVPGETVEVKNGDDVVASSPTLMLVPASSTAPL